MNVTTSGYEFLVRGHLDDHWAGWLGELTTTRNDDGTTTLIGPIADQAQLHGLLAGLRDIGATILSLASIDTSEAAERSGHGEGRPPSTWPVLERPLHTERLRLRPATVDDADASWGLRQLESVSQWLTGAPADIDGYRALFAEPERLAPTVIVELTDDSGAQTIGDFMVRRVDARAQTEVTDQAQGAQAELGWVLDPAYSGHGYGTEAARELLHYCFTDLGVRRVVAHSFLDNEASWHLMERLGMRREAHAIRESLHRCGLWLDTVVYALLADEWACAVAR